MTTVLFETHSLTIDNECGIATGWLPGGLSEHGRELARELGERHRRTAPATVFVSDLARAVETATIAFAGSGVPIVQDRRLRECDYGVLNGAPVARVTEGGRARHIDQPYPGGQSYRQVVEQTRSFLGELAARVGGDADGGPVLVIAHSANKWALDCLLAGARLADLVDAPFGWREGWSYQLPPGWSG